MKRSLSIAVGLALVLSVCAHGGDSLKENFANPPEAARAWCYWWWLNGCVTQDAIVRDLDEMKRQGISGGRAALFNRKGHHCVPLLAC